MESEMELDSVSGELGQIILRWAEYYKVTISL